MNFEVILDWKYLVKTFMTLIHDKISILLLEVQQNT